MEALPHVDNNNLPIPPQNLYDQQNNNNNNNNNINSSVYVQGEIASREEQLPIYGISIKI